MPTLARLPDLRLPAVPGGESTPIRSPRREGGVVLLLHAADCSGCLAYLERLAESEESLREWEARVIAIAPDAASIPATLPFRVLSDREGRFERISRLAPGSLVIADQWGEVFHVHDGVPGEHAFPGPPEVVEWMRFVAIQCPECQGEAL